MEPEEISDRKAPLLYGEPSGKPGCSPLYLIKSAFERSMNRLDQSLWRVEVGGSIIFIFSEPLLKSAALHFGGVTVHDSKNNTIPSHPHCFTDNLYRLLVIGKGVHKRQHIKPPISKRHVMRICQSQIPVKQVSPLA